MHIHVLLRCCAFSHALPHIRHGYAAVFSGSWRGGVGHITSLLRCCVFSCTSIHTSLHDAAVPFLMHFHTYVMLRCCVFSWHFHIIRHATLLTCFAPQSPDKVGSKQRCHAVVALLAMEAWKHENASQILFKKNQKDRQNVEISLIRPAVWKGMNASSPRNHVATNPNLYTWYLQVFEQKLMNLNPLCLIHFWFSKTFPTVIFYWYLQCFFNVIISHVWKRSRGFRSAGMYMNTHCNGMFCGIW